MSVTPINEAVREAMKEPPRMPKILACVPTYDGKTAWQFTDSYVVTHMHLATHGVEMELKVAPGFSLIQYARNWLTSFFLKGDYTHLLWIDSDLGWSPEAVLRMLRRNVDVIGGVYPIKSAVEAYPYMPIREPENGMQEVQGLPGGFMLCSRHAMERAASSVRMHSMAISGQAELVPNVFDIVHEGPNLWGEDYVFCKRLRNLGFTLWAETDIDFTHIGTRVWEGNLAKRIAIEPKEEKGVA